MPALAGLSLSGASSGTVTGFRSSDDIDFRVSGASSLRLVDVAAGDAALAVSGASRVELPDLPSRDADVRLSGASRATVRLDGRLSVAISGASHLEYIGRPTLGTLDISGASTLSGR